MIDGDERYLVVRLTALGDILHTVPAVAALRAAHKSARIDWVVDENGRPFWKAARRSTKSFRSIVDRYWAL